MDGAPLGQHPQQIDDFKEELFDGILMEFLASYKIYICIFMAAYMDVLQQIDRRLLFLFSFAVVEESNWESTNTFNYSCLSSNSSRILWKTH